ncbi:MAG: hypothetical protein K0R57_3708 [Paenibacillaceae bacterium]|jgi:beta-mannanase|nr:hypothetical protein [Paenibacillaceae bacterium]
MMKKVWRWLSSCLVAVLMMTAVLSLGPQNEARAAENARSGVWSMRAVVSGTPSWKGANADLAVSANTNYTLKYWLSGKGKITAKVLNSNWSSSLVSSESTATADWTQVTLNFNSGSNTTLHLQFQDNGYTAGTLYLDDVFLGVNGGTNLLANGDFEAGYTGGWYIPDDAASIFSVIKPQGDTRTGNWAMKAVFSGAATWDIAYQTVSGIPANTAYTASFWMKGDKNIRLRVLSSNWSTVLLEQTFTGTGDWSQKTFSFNTGSHSSLILVFADNSGAAGTVYLDDAFLGVAGGTNRLQNPGFENGNSGWTINSAAIYSIFENGPDRRVAFKSGLYAGNSLTVAAEQETWLGRDDFYLYHATGKVDWADYTGSIDWAIDTLWEHTDHKIFWNVPLITKNEGTLAEAAAGTYNDKYQYQAEQIAAFCADYDEIYVRNSWEFNGDWFPWTVLAGEGENQTLKTQHFTQAFREFVDTFRNVSDKFRFEWNVNVGKDFPLETAYPGNSYVDIIGMDIYDEGTSDAQNRFQYALTRSYGLNWLRDFANARNKPIAISEWGVGGRDSGDSPVMVENMYNFFRATNTVFQLYWDSNADYGGQLRPVTSYPNASAKFKQLFGSYTGPSKFNTVGNVIAAVTSPGPAFSPLPASPKLIQGIALDPDGNGHVTGITVTIQNAAGQYLNQATHTFGGTPVYNPAVYNSTSGYWTLSLSGTVLNSGSGAYSIKAYANDGAPSAPGMRSFTR